MQSRSGMMLRQMYEEVVHNKPKTSHVGDPLGGKRPNATKPKPGMSSCHTDIAVVCACMHDATVSANVSPCSWQCDLFCASVFALA